MRALAGCLAVIAVLVFVPAAAAKEVSRAEVCGAGGCASFSAKHGAPGLRALAEGGSIVGPPAHGAPYFVVRIEIRGDGAFDRFTNHWVPSLNLIRGEQGTWMEMPADGKALLAKLTAYLEPLAASTLPLSASRDSLAVARAQAIATAAPPSPAADSHKFPWLWAVIAACAAVGAGLLVWMRLRRAHPADGHGAAAGA